MTQTVTDFVDGVDGVRGGVAAAVGQRFDTVAALSEAPADQLTDVKGVLDADGQLIREMNLAQAREAIASGVATGGMIPKLDTATNVVEAGVQAVVILDGRRPHAMLVELFSEHGAGTLISA